MAISLYCASLVRAALSTGIERLPEKDEIQLSTETQGGLTYELQSSTNLTDWQTDTSPQPGDGNKLSIVRSLASGIFYRFFTTEAEAMFAPEIFPFDRLQDFGVYIPGFEEEISIEPLDDNSVGFEVEMHTDPENFIGVRGEMEYAIRPDNPNTADLLITYAGYTTRNSTSGNTSEQNPEQQAAATKQPQIKEILYIFLFENPNSGASTITYQYTDGSEEVFEGGFELF